MKTVPALIGILPDPESLLSFAYKAPVDIGTYTRNAPYFLFPVGIKGRRLAAVSTIKAQLIDQNCDQREQQLYGAFQSRGLTSV